MEDSRTGAGVAYDPAALDEIEKQYWRDIWRTALYDAVVEKRIDLARFGPVQAAIVSGEPEVPAVNFLLGAATPGAVEGGHLADAIEWVDFHDVDYRVSVPPCLAGAGAAEDWLNRNGYERGEGWAKLVRDTSPPRFSEPEGIEVDELETDDECEILTFSELMAESMGPPHWTMTSFFDLRDLEGWRCYRAIDDPSGYLVASAAIRIDEGVAEIGFATTPEATGGGVGQVALLHRVITDAAAGCHTLTAQTGPERPMASRCGLLRAGFEEAYVRPDWRLPSFVVAEP